MSELSFLIELLLEHKLPKKTRDAVAARIREVECSLQARPSSPQLPNPMPLNIVLPPGVSPNQAPSTLAAMARHAQQTGGEAPQPVAVIAQTPAAAAAMAQRQDAINASILGKKEEGRTSPRKF